MSDGRETDDLPDRGEERPRDPSSDSPDGDGDGPPDRSDEAGPTRDGHVTAVADRLARFDRVVEVGIGDRFDVAVRLADRGVDVTATDLRPRSPPGSVRFVVDDVTDPDLSIYRHAEAVYALRCPPELQTPIAAVARRCDAAVAFTTLGGDPAVVDARPETIPGGTLYWAVDRDERR